jgi:hypothetical protein
MMHSLSATELLAAWEQGTGQPPVYQALVLLAAACPEISFDELARLPIGRRDTCLLTLREWTFGQQLAGLADCPGCGERLEMTFHTADIRRLVNPEGLTTPLGLATEESELFSLTMDDYQAQFRLPNSRDLLAIVEQSGKLPDRRLLLERCLLATTHDGSACGTGDLPEQVIEAILERMTSSDPQADIRLALLCPTCGHQWTANFDIVSFFWEEINAWGPRILAEVHTLASAYGWREADILALSPWRRRAYLELLAGY